MISRIPRRLGFARFQGIRPIREGILTVRMVPDPSAAGVHVAFATPKRIGPAVVRNRVRRQVRALMHAQAAALEVAAHDNAEFGRDVVRVGHAAHHGQRLASVGRFARSPRRPWRLRGSGDLLLRAYSRSKCQKLETIVTFKKEAVVLTIALSTT